MDGLKRYLGVGLAVAMLAAGGSANADIIFTLGNNPQPDEENILFGDNSGPLIEQGNTVTGEADSGPIVFFTSNEELITPSSGQARVEATDGGFTTLTFGVQDGTFGDFILNPNLSGTGNISQNIHVVVDQVVGPDATFDYTGTNGNNFLTILAINGQRISTITISTAGQFEFLDLRQPRISSPTECPPGSTDPLCTGIPGGLVPEPAMLSLMAIGLLAMGAFVARSRRRRH